MHVNKFLLISGLFSSMLLVGCGTTQPITRIETKTVEIPIPVPCKEEEPPKPKFCFERLDTSVDIHKKAKCLLSDRQLRIAYEIELEAKLKACK